MDGLKEWTFIYYRGIIKVLQKGYYKTRVLFIIGIIGTVPYIPTPIDNSSFL